MRGVCILVLAVMFVTLPLHAQHQLHIRVMDRPTTHPADPIYLSGNFNNWEPADEAMQLQQLDDGSWGITVQLYDVPSDRLEFKFTRGDWQSSECTAHGRLVGPRLAQLNQDLELTCEIEGWRDDFPSSTASVNVHVLDSAFYIPQLDRHRKILIYLPENYASSDQRYPVIYMQDGQHLFDEATSQGRIGPIEWGVDETLDAAAAPSIIVAINHQDDYRDREPEFYFYPNVQHPHVEGQQYAAFIVETLKPYVDTHYRTYADRAHTAIAGSSLGGLISLYTGLEYPEVFGIMGIFSPSIWMDENNLKNYLQTYTKRDALAQQQYYFYAGQQENRRKEDGTFVRMQDDVDQIIPLLRHVGNPHITTATNPDGRHGALYWREAFPAFYQWFSSQVENKAAHN